MTREASWIEQLAKQSVEGSSPSRVARDLVQFGGAFGARNRFKSCSPDLGRVAESVDAPDLKSVDYISRGGSSPPSPTSRN